MILSIIFAELQLAKFKFLNRTNILICLFLLVGCESGMESVLLRYTPQVGSSYSYKFKVNRPHAPIEIPGEMLVLGKDDGGYRIQFSGVLNELFSGSLIVTERHNSNHPGYISLNFPDDPVEVGAEWSGEVSWYYEDYYVFDPTELRLPASYKLLGIEQGEKGRFAVIEQRIEADVAVDGLVFYVGQAGVRWDRDGKITDLHQNYDAYGKLEVGDVIVGINGQRAKTAGELSMLAEKYIQHPKQNKTVTFTVLMDGEENTIDVEKSIDEFALVKVYNKRDVMRIAYDVDRGILLSVEASSAYDVAYTSPAAGSFPVVDDYAGFHKFGYMAGRSSYHDHIESNGPAWVLSLDEG